jgi:dihydroorotase
MALWIKGGCVVDPVAGTEENRDIILEKGRISRILPPDAFDQAGPRIMVVDASGKIVVPGLMDMHVHLREPGQEHKETIETGGRAALAGGFTALACMPNTVPVHDHPSVTAFILERARRSTPVRVLPIAAVTKGQGGVHLTRFQDLKRAGAVALSDDGMPVESPDIMKRALEAAARYGLPIISHCEDLSLSSDGVMHEGSVSRKLGLRGIPSTSEEIAVQREISLAKQTNCPVHIAHVSTSGSVSLIRKAKENHIPITAETAPHYFTLDHRAVMAYNTNAKMNPPLREEKDVSAVQKGLKEGVIDVIATDHAPHSPSEKEAAFEKAPFGIIGLETAVPLTLALVRSGVLTLPAAIQKLTTEPAAVLGVGGGTLKEGDRADVVIIDPHKEYTLRAEDVYSKSRNSPFINQTLQGRNEITIIGGTIAWQR